MNTDLIKQWALMAVRYLTPWLAAWIAKKGGITDEQAAEWIGVTGTLVMVLWGAANKWRYETKLNTALDAPQGASKRELKEIIAEGSGTSAITPK